MTIDKNTLDLARQWAADIDADRQTLSQDTIDAAADLISSLPESWVGADTLRKYISDWREGLATAPRGNYEAEMLDDLEDMLPTPPAPRTMAGIEWDDAEHQGLEAVYKAGTKWESVVRMLYPLEHDGRDGIVCVERTGWVFRPYPRDLTPLSGTKINLTPTSTLDDEDGKPAPESAAPRPDDEPVFHPDYIYTDRDGNEWEHLHGRWITGDTHAERVAAREGGPGRASLPGVYGPYRKDRLVPETTEESGEAGDDHASHCASCAEMDDDEPEFDPAYTYRDRDGDEWTYYASNRMWICRDSRGWAIRADSVPPAEYGPYTRITKENQK